MGTSLLKLSIYFYWWDFFKRISDSKHHPEVRGQRVTWNTDLLRTNSQQRSRILKQYLLHLERESLPSVFAII